MSGTETEIFIFGMLGLAIGATLIIMVGAALVKLEDIERRLFPDNHQPTEEDKT